MDRKTSTGARALKLVIAMAFIGCALALPQLRAQADPGVIDAPGKVRGRARASAAASQVLPQPSGQPASANAPSSAAVAPVSSTLALTHTVFLPFIQAADRYLDWVALGQPAGAVAVNNLYVSQQCTNDRPAVILAGTDQGLYSYGTAWTLNTGLAAEIQVSQVFSTTQGELYVSSYNLGLWRSANGGATWDSDPTPNNDARVYGLAQNSQYLYAAAGFGVYRRSITGGPWSQIRTGVIYSVAAAGSTVYAVQVNAPGTKDTLLISNDGGATWPITRQLPGTLLYIQSLDADPASGQLLLGVVDGGIWTLDSANNFVSFSQGLSQRVYGTWRDAQKRVYAAIETPGGLRRFAPSGGASNLDLSALPSGGSLTAQNLYTIAGSTTCNIIAVGSEAGGVWMRRVP